jgi:prepilin-type N-terminal cleavage/methylation domain-containing protein
MDSPARSKRRPRRRPAPARGFTLIELTVVIVIIGIIMSLLLTVAFGGIRRAEERATQALIAKLETGLDDRLQALLELRPDYNNAHYYMAAVYNGNVAIFSPQRADVIALFDQIKAEVPDVFIYNPSNSDYPLNFAAQAFSNGSASPLLLGSAPNHASYFLPLGNGYADAPGSGSFGASNSSGQWNPLGTGIYGASYAAAAGFYKNLGYQPGGYDGADNNGNGLVDEVAESGVNLTTLQTQLAKHTHKTARAEALYAVLVEGQGPLGSIFNADEFTDKEVRDTDGDGLPEFVDAWGEPLQFYRWPIYHHSDHQRGVVVTPSTAGTPTILPPYTSAFDPREQDPLDPNQQLLSPSWWGAYNQGTGTDPVSGSTFQYSSMQTAASPLSPGATAFTTFFHPLTEPLAKSGPPATAFTFWDRTGSSSPPYYPRRAFFTKFLIVSSGPDKELGIARLDTVPNSSGQAYTAPYNVFDVLIESQARSSDLVASDAAYMVPSSLDPTVPATSNPLSVSAQDDISNHNYQAPGGIVQ